VHDKNFMIQRRTFLSLLAGASAASYGGIPALLSACASAQTLAIGIHPWIGYEPLYLAQAFGWLPPDVQLRPGTNASGSLAGLRTGELHGAAITLDEMLLARADGVALSAILVFNNSVGADAVVARPEIITPANLAGKRIAVERSAAGELVLAHLLDMAKLDRKAVEILAIPPDQQLDAWCNGALDAAVTYQPTLSLLEREGAKRLLDSRQFPGKILDVLAIRRDVRLPFRALAQLAHAHFRGLRHLQINRQDALHRIAAWRGTHIAEIEQALAGVALPNVAGNRHYLMPQGALAQAAQALNTVMTRNTGVLAPGLLPRPDTLADLADPRYLPTEEVL